MNIQACQKSLSLKSLALYRIDRGCQDGGGEMRQREFKTMMNYLTYLFYLQGNVQYFNTIKDLLLTKGLKMEGTSEFW